VIEDRGLRRTRGRAIVMACDRMEELCEDGGVEVRRALLDRSQAEVHVPEQSAFLRLSEGRPAPELPDTPDVV